jgi:aminotransferase, class V
MGAEVLAVSPRGLVEDTAWETADEQVAVISVVRVNNETGVIHPLDGLIAASSRTGAWSHSDAVQALGHVPLDFHVTGLDLMSVSAHKIGGPVGIGALAVKRGVTPAPIGLGGGQEGRIRSGTLPVALAASFAAAATAAVVGLEAETRRLVGLRDGIRETILACGGSINGTNCAPHIVSATFPGIRAQDLLFLLDAEDIHASAGSACRAGVHRPSEVMLAMGSSEDEAMSTVRFSLGHTSGQGDVDRLREVLPAAVERARVAS